MTELSDVTGTHVFGLGTVLALTYSFLPRLLKNPPREKLASKSSKTREGVTS